MFGSDFPFIVWGRDLPTIISYDRIAVIVFDKLMNIPQGFDLNGDRHCKFHKIECLGSWVDVVYDKRGHSKPAFKSLSRIQSGFRSQETLAMSVMGSSSKELAMVIQLERRRQAGWKPFSFIDELLLRTTSTVLSLRFDCEVLGDKLRDETSRSESLVRTVTRILDTNSQTSLIQEMRKQLPKLHGFEDLGVLFYNPANGRLYNVLDSGSDEGESQIISYSANLGICGEMVTDPRVRIQDSKSALAFHGEVDGVQTVARVKNFLFGPLFASSGGKSPRQLLAIMQFVNKEGGDAVTEKDIQLFNQMSTLYGLLVEKAIEKQNVVNTVLRLKDRTSAITQLLPSEGTADDGPHLAHIAGSLRNFGEIVDNFAAVRNSRVIKKLLGTPGAAK